MTELLGSFTPFVVLAAWLTLVVCLEVLLVRLVRESPADVGWALGLGVIAFVLRLAPPSGPLNFVDTARLQQLWGPNDGHVTPYQAIGVLLSELQLTGVSIRFLMRTCGAVFGAAAVLATYACARAFSLSRGASVLAALVVLTWPAHIRFSAAPSSSVEMGALAVGVFASLAAPGLGRIAVPLVAALTTLLLFVRPEARLLLIPVGVLLWSRHWTVPRRLAVAAAMLPAALIYLRVILNPDPFGFAGLSRFFMESMFLKPLSSGLVWVVLACVGLFLDVFSLRIRISILVSFALLLGTYWVLASDPSPQWGQWRYYVTLVPLLAVAAAAVWERIPAARRAGALIPFGFLLVVPDAVSWAAIVDANDQQAEYAFISATIADVLGRDDEVSIIESGDATEGALALVRADAFGRIKRSVGCEYDVSRRSRARNPLQAPPARILDVVIADCPEQLPRETVLFLGAHRSETAMATIRSRYDMEVISEKVVTAMNETPWHVTQCPAPAWNAHPRPKGADCALKLGWYRLRLKS